MSKEKEKQYVAKVIVRLKPTVNDPEGISIGGAIRSLGFEGIGGVRSGKYFEVPVTSTTKKKAEKQVDQICARLLANPVIETYSFELEGA